MRKGRHFFYMNIYILPKYFVLLLILYYFCKEQTSKHATSFHHYISSLHLCEFYPAHNRFRIRSIHHDSTSLPHAVLR